MGTLHHCIGPLVTPLHYMDQFGSIGCSQPTLQVKEEGVEVAHTCSILSVCLSLCALNTFYGCRCR